MSDVDPPPVTAGSPAQRPDPMPTIADPTPIVDAVRSALESFLPGPGAVREGGPATLIVALSGGLDSVVLLHVLRFALAADVRGAEVRLVAAHFDHGMRPGSARDAAWVRGLCRAWDVELALETAADRPTSEDDARTARYRFLEEVASAYDRPTVLTAHHADDQAETVLFRALRGTGIDGLAGIPRLRPLRVPKPTSGGAAATSGSAMATVARPLLDLWREELEAYAAHHGLRWRDDPTNEHLGYARNVLRHEILPMAEERVAAGARRALVRLAGVARGEDAAWTSAMPLVLDAIDADRAAGAHLAAEVDHGPGAELAANADLGPEAAREISCDRKALLALVPELSARVVRHLVTSVGHTIDADATRRAVDFIRDSQSGRRIELGAGVELSLEGDRVVVGR